MIAVAVASEALMARLEANKADLAKLADPRTIQMNDTLADEIARRAAPVYYITGTIHSTEAGAPTALMELAYRLAVDESALHPQHPRPCHHADYAGRRSGRPRSDGRSLQLPEGQSRTRPCRDLLYWGKYVAHDNNRDAMGVHAEAH